MRVLIAVASKYGSTREIADAISEVLKGDRLTVDVLNAADITEVQGYDAVILGSAIYAGSWLPEAQQFAERQHAELANLPVWAFSSGPLGNEYPQPQDDPAMLAAALGDLNVISHRVFVGKIDFKELSLTERMIYKAFHTPEGDFRNWDDICAWAHEISTAVSS